MEKTLVLGIETSCDETALALLEAHGGIRTPKFKVLKSLVASQIAIHAPFGGVVPNLAKREHIRNLPILFEKLFHASRFTRHDIGLITVTVGPGLEPALWTGIAFAKELQKTLKQRTRSAKPPLVGANHLEGHLYSFLLNPRSSILAPRKLFPAIALIVSGGHTILLKVDSFLKWKKLGETRDDAVGEAYDKVARLLRLPYPGGPEIERLAKKGNPNAIPFPRPMIGQKNYDFSFSGLKTAVLYHLRDTADTDNANIAASFQAAAIEVLAAKTFRAAEEFGAKSVLLSGGVAANKTLRGALKKETQKRKLRFLVPDIAYNTDNAAMIAAAGYMAYLRKKRYRLIAKGGLHI